MKTLSKLGRFIYAVPFGLFGLYNFMNAPKMARVMLNGWPVAEGLVYIAGLALILAAISIIINIKAKLACLLLTLFLIILVLGVHLPEIGGSGPMADIAMSNLLKDLALAGAALTYSGILKK